ncbi:hypothetical protein [Lignipirellula cremea]|uniref:Glycosyl hydrolase family 32 N-terminal domain-containing protein n=1 Tax=Lignipirellula cremea TaxID=2528010 RepID=A0A518DWS2_9BACT|nr:hypothetical protein [Lignipirellula cremea]QDU96280.1 hypothetical protein Pla8534_41000 [Lignipirellula cremea]
MNGSEITRRNWLKSTSLLTLGAASSAWMPPRAQTAEAATPAVIDIGSRRELFIDDVLIERMDGAAQRRLHHPQPQGIVLEHDEKWEGSGSGYHSVFQDGDLYRMYYKAWHLEATPGRLDSQRHPLYCCYAESKDGILWTKPALGLVEFAGSRQNNIVLASDSIPGMTIDAGHPAVFKDENPAAPDSQRYKAFVRSPRPGGLYALGSSDGLHWNRLASEPVITEGAFDSQNLAFWDPAIGKYRAYWRIFTQGIRAIRTATSEDFLHWGPASDLTYEDSPVEHLYTNQVKPYYRAPHLLIGFPSRYLERSAGDSLDALPEAEHRRLRSSARDRYGKAVTEGLLMASRDGVHFQRWNEAFLRPGVERAGTWNYGHQYLAWHLVETSSAIEDAPPEISLYAVESYWTKPGSKLRRYTLRRDGFVSVSAPMRGGELTTRPIKFRGKELRLNFATSAAGNLFVELQDADGKALPGYRQEDCQSVFGDTHDRVVTWKQGADVSSLVGRPIRLRFRLEDADLYAFRFQD